MVFTQPNEVLENAWKESSRDSQYDSPGDSFSNIAKQEIDLEKTFVIMLSKAM